MAFGYNLPNLDIGKAVRRQREIKGYSATSFAEEMGWSKSLISKIENGTRTVSAEELYRMACVLGEPVEKFFPEIATNTAIEERSTVSGFADDIRRLYYAISKLNDNAIPVDMELEASELFQRRIPAAIYELLNVNPNRVSIKGTLKRGPHFIPRIEIHFLDRNRNTIDWFYIILSFKDRLKHIYISLIQSTDIRYRADCAPIDQGIQLDIIKESLAVFLDSRYGIQWKRGITENVFLDENGKASEYGAIFSRGYIPVCPPDEYDVWHDRIEDSMRMFVEKNDTGKTVLNGIVPQYVVNSNRDNKINGSDYLLFDCIDKDIESMFEMLKMLVEAVETRCFVSWKKDIITSGGEGFSSNYDYSGLGWIHHMIDEYGVSHELNESQKLEYEALLLLSHLLNTTSDPLGVLNEIKRQMGSDAEECDSDIRELGGKSPLDRRYTTGYIAGQYISRNPQKRMKIMAEQNYKCEVDSSHKSFVDRTGHPYMEIHYLIPMSAQGDFKKDLNVEANMVCVCPICNRKLAHASESVIEDAIVPLYYSHKDKLKEAGFDISLRQLLQYYQ